MKLYSVITQIVFMASVAQGVTSPITEMALREFQANTRHQAARQKMFNSGRHRSPSHARRIPAGSAISFADLFKHLAAAQKASDKRRRQLNTFNQMLKITTEFKN